MGFNRRFDPAYEELKALVVSGKLGAPLVAHCAHRNANYPAQYDDVVAVTGTAIHEIDTMAWLVGDYFTKHRLFSRSAPVTPRTRTCTIRRSSC